MKRAVRVGARVAARAAAAAADVRADDRHVGVGARVAARGLLAERRLAPNQAQSAFGRPETANGPARGGPGGGAGRGPGGWARTRRQETPYYASVLFSILPKFRYFI